MRPSNSEGRERPILFSGPMVRAVLDGRKSQTRRVMKPQPVLYGNKSSFPGHFAECEGRWSHVTPNPNGTWNENSKPVKCPYGQPGDPLYVKQPWLAITQDGNRAVDDWRKASRFIGRYTDGPDVREVYWPPTRWRNARFMPKVAARIWLRVTNVRVERVQDISEADTKSEGVVYPENAWSIANFVELWDSINKKLGFEWKSNPWVWVVEFTT